MRGISAEETMGISPTSRMTAWLAIVLLSQGCALKTIAMRSVADALSQSGDTFASDDDPELVRDAAPFALKTYESLLSSLPEHRGLLLATCSGFTQYSYAFVQADAEVAEATDFARSMALRERSLKLYLRGRDYCLRVLELVRPGIRLQMMKDPAGALQPLTRAHVPLLYWTGASWGAAVSLGIDRPALVGDLPVVRAVFERALALDEAYEEGALHQVLISLEAVPEAMGGSVARARAHFERAIALSNGHSAEAYVTLASAVALPEQDRAEFVRLLDEALAVDAEARPRRRLATLLAQRRARYLLSRIDDLFLPEERKQP
jgi:predicted anti-sigma-YlaC factor YlaD